MTVFGDLNLFSQAVERGMANIGGGLNTGLTNIGSYMGHGMGKIAEAMVEQAQAEDRKADAMANISQGFLDVVDLLKDMEEYERAQKEKEA